MRQQVVFKIDQVGVAAGLDPRLLGCPFILDAEDDLSCVNRYLEALHLGEWPIGSSGTRRAGRRVFRWMPSSISAAASKLYNIARWCRNGRMHLGGAPAILSVTEPDLDRYAQQQEAGLWSEAGTALQPSTIGGRQLAYTDFREWAASTGHASRLELSLRSSMRNIPNNGGGLNKCEVSRPLVFRRASPSAVRFPSSTTVRSALLAVDDVALLLGMKLILFCGLRRSEVVSIRVSDVTRPSAGLQQFIRCVGKGRKERQIEVDSDLLSGVKDYLQFERPMRLAGSDSSTDCLLINWRTGRPYNPRSVWKIFRSVDTGISPHLGRHWYAVHYLLRAWKREQSAAMKGGNTIARDLMSAVLSTDLLRLQLNLGHAESTTTVRYLVALGQYLDVDGISVTFQDYLGSSDVD